MSDSGSTPDLTARHRNYWAPHVTVAGIVEHDGRFLMVEEEIQGKVVMTQPAGHLEPGEHLVAAITREVFEETGIAVAPTALVGIYRWFNPANDSTWLRFTFCAVVTGVSTTPNPQDPDILGAGWYTEAQIRAEHHRLRSPQVLAGIDDYNSGRRIDLDVIQELTEDSALEPIS